MTHFPKTEAGTVLILMRREKHHNEETQGAWTFSYRQEAWRRGEKSPFRLAAEGQGLPPLQNIKPPQHQQHTAVLAACRKNCHTQVGETAALHLFSGASAINNDFL